MSEPVPVSLPAAIASSGSGFPLSVISLAGSHWQGQVREASLPGAAGRLGVMPGHIPLLAPLRSGVVRLFPLDGSAMVELQISGGYVEVQPGEVIVLADLVLRGDTADERRAEQARAAALSPLADALTSAEYANVHGELTQHLAELSRLMRRR